jgi:hypothetical protein
MFDIIIEKNYERVGFEESRYCIFGRLSHILILSTNLRLAYVLKINGFSICLESELIYLK